MRIGQSQEDRNNPAHGYRDYDGDRRNNGSTVQTSLDGKTWAMAADHLDNKELSIAEGYTCRFDPRPTRYIRITMPHNSANTGRHLVEVMAYEE